MSALVTTQIRKLFAGSDALAVSAAIASVSVVGTGLGLSGPLLSLLMEAKGVSSTLNGANTAMAGVAALTIVPFTTAIARKLGVVNALLINILLATALFLLFYITEPLPAWFILRFFFSCNLAMIFVLSEFWINSAAATNNRGMILGIYATTLSIGFAIGPAIVSAVGIHGFTPFAIGAGLLAAASIPAWIARHRGPVMEKEGKTPSILPYLLMVPLATGAAFVFGAVEQTQLALLPVFGTRSGFDTTGAALLLTVLSCGHVLFQIPLGMWSDRISDRRIILLICTIVGIAGSILLPLVVGTTWLLYLIVFLWGGTVGGLYTVGLAHLGSRLSGSDLAQANAAFILCYALGMFVGPQLTGLLMDGLGPAGFGISVLVFFVLYLVLYLSRLKAHQDAS
ncbi:MAG: MFS transporter [Rhizobiaceae bacterium]|nr:MFS transporter [Rhizobiaceae bacterium]